MHTAHQTFLVPKESNIVSLEEAPVGNGTTCNWVLVQAHKRRLALHSGGGVGVCTTVANSDLPHKVGVGCVCALKLLTQTCPTQWGWGGGVH